MNPPRSFGPALGAFTDQFLRVPMAKTTPRTGQSNAETAVPAQSGD